MRLEERLKRLGSAVDALTLRERIMLFIAALAVTGVLWEALLAAPLGEREQRVRDRIETTRERIAELDESMTLAAAGIGEGMSDQVERMRALELRIVDNDETVRIFTSDLVDPEEMRVVLEALIGRRRDLRLVRASNLEVRPLIEDGEAETASDAVMLYRHGLRLELSGSYLDCLEYLEAIERLPWRLYFGGMSLVSESYPLNAITLEIFTLSLDENWIGI